MSSPKVHRWQDLQDAMELASTLWVCHDDGTWTREPHPVMDVDHDYTFEDNLHRLGFTAMKRKDVSLPKGQGRQTREYAWRRYEGANVEYLYEVTLGVTTDGLTLEHVAAVGLPAYLQLLRQLREAGLIS